MSADLHPIRTAAEQALSSAIDATLAAAPASGPIADLRRAAAKTFTENGLPTRRVEEWHYTDLRALMREALPIAGAPDAAAVAEAGKGVVAFPEAVRIVFVNGTLVESLSDLASLPAGLTVTSLEAALASGDPLLERIGSLSPKSYDGALALNTAFLRAGLLIKVAAGATVEKPLHVAHVFTGAAAATYARNVIVVEDGAKATLIESFAGVEGVAYQANDAMEMVVGAGATLEHVRLQEEGAKALHLGTLMLDLGKEATFNSFTLTAGAATSRVSLYGKLTGEGAHLGIRGANLLKARQHGDMTLVIEHIEPGCDSRELIKSVLADEARGVFQGKIVVRPEAQKTDGRMMSQALLLGDNAEMDNKPELEIFADDVQCGHGATAGAMDENLMFYMMARGIAKAEAEALLIQAFVGEAVEFVTNEAVRETLIARMEAWLKARAA